MNSNSKANQPSQACCADASESFDCAAMMEKFKNCCEGDNQKVSFECCTEIKASCCEPADGERAET